MNILKITKRKLKVILVIILVASNLLVGFPLQTLVDILGDCIKDRKVVDALYWAAKDTKVIDSFLTGIPPKIIKEAKAATSTYDFSVCAGTNTCDSDTGWWASDDDVDVFPFANNSANRNNHTENVDADYTALASSNDSRQASANPGTSDEIFMWFEMTINEDPADIAQITFTYEGYTTSTTNFSIYIKDDSTAFQNDVAWIRVGTVESITASTEETVTRTLAGIDFSNYIDANGLIVWAVYEAASAVVVSTDYVSLTVTTHTVEQEGYRWRNDNGSESTATWIAAQDIDITQPTGTNTRLRTILNDTAAGNQATTQYQLEYKLSSDNVYRPVRASSGSVAYGSAGTASANQINILQITAPAAVNNGDLLVMAIANKYPSNGPTTPTGWTAISNNQQSGGIGTTGVDTGQVYATVYVREAEGWEDSVVFSVNVPSANSSEGQIVRYTKGTGKEWDLAATNGSDNTGDATWSVTGASDPGITSGDIVVVTSAVNTDLYNYSAEAITATGLTMGTQTERNETAGTGGDDVELVISDHVVSSGTATSAPTFTMTSTGSSATAPGGASIILRIRQVDAPIQLAASDNIAVSGENTTPQLTAPSGEPTFTQGRIQDDENPADTVDINDGEYTEMEWSITATNQASNSEVYQFRVTANGEVLTDYTVTPQWTIGSTSVTFTLANYRFYVNAASEDVSDPWGNPNIDESTAITTLPATNDSPESGDEIRLRAAITVNTSDLSATSQQFKLQYKAGTDSDCTTGSWSDVGVAGGGTIWRFTSLTDVSDGTTLSTMRVTSDVREVYARSNPTAMNPNGASAGQEIEYDFHFVHNGAADATTYSFRVVESDETVFNAYTNCPTLTTRPGMSGVLRHGEHFADNVEQGFIWAD